MLRSVLLAAGHQADPRHVLLFNLVNDGTPYSSLVVLSEISVSVGVGTFGVH